MKLKFFESNLKTLLFFSFVLFCIQFFYTFFPSRIPLIQETHFFLTQIALDNVFLDDASSFYSLLVTPVYFVLYPIFTNPSYFFISSIIFEFFFILYIFCLISATSKNYLASFIAIIILSPLASATIHNIFGIYFFPNPSPAFEWGNGTISVRYLLGLIFPLQIYLISRNKNFLSFLLLLSSLIIHPNSFLFILGINVLGEIYLSLIGKGHKKRLFLFLIALVVSLLYLFSKFDIFGGGLNESYLISNNVERYLNLVRDEGDDFSIIYQVTQNSLQTIIISIFIIVTLLGFSSIHKKKFYEDVFFIYTFIPLTLFYFGLVIEILSIRWGLDFLLNLIIGLQPGHKLLSFSFFPALFLWSKYLAYYIESYDFKIRPIILVSFSTLLFGLSINGAIKSFDFFNDLKQIEKGELSYGDALILKSKFLKERNPSTPIIYELREYKDQELKNLSSRDNLNIDQNYEGKYGKIEAFEGLVSLVRNNTPSGSGIVIPPYLFHLRDTLINYKIFFQEHHDGNIMMGSLLASQNLLVRMKAVLGVTYSSLPLQATKYNYSAMRYFYRKLDIEKAKLIKQKFKNYEYILTEKDHKLKTELISSNEFYNLYKITR